MVQFPCVLCSKCVKTKQKALLCTSCQKWVHISCSGISTKQYNDTSEQFLDWECAKCILRHLPNYIVNNSESEVNKIPNNKSPECQKIENVTLKYDQLSEKGIKFDHLNIVSLLKYYEEIKQIMTEKLNTCSCSE